MKTYFKIKAQLDPKSIEDLSYLDDRELHRIFESLSNKLPELVLLCSIGDDEEVDVLSVDDKPLVHNKMIDLFGGSVTSESEFQ